MGITRERSEVTRRGFLQLSVAGMLGAAAGPVTGWGRQTGRTGENTKRPNIVFIIADDMGWADVGYHSS